MSEKGYKTRVHVEESHPKDYCAQRLRSWHFCISVSDSHDLPEGSDYYENEASAEENKKSNPMENINLCKK